MATHTLVLVSVLLLFSHLTCSMAARSLSTKIGNQLGETGEIRAAGQNAHKIMNEESKRAWMGENGRILAELNDYVPGANNNPGHRKP